MNAVVINFFKTAMNPTTKLVTDMVKCVNKSSGLSHQSIHT
jgi:hypothetical protein